MSLYWIKSQAFIGYYPVAWSSELMMIFLSEIRTVYHTSIVVDALNTIVIIFLLDISMSLVDVSTMGMGLEIWQFGFCVKLENDKCLLDILL